MPVLLVVAFISPEAAFAKWEIVDRLNLAPFVPRVLDAFMMVAHGGYEYFVGHGDGIIYLFVWGFLAASIFMYAFKMYFPKRWLEFFGFSGGGEMWDGKVSGFATVETVLKSAVRAIVAASLLLPIKPIMVTKWLVNPFLEFGAIYTKAITDNAKITGVVKQEIDCPQSVLSSDWISKNSCKFLIQPISDLSSVNNAVVKRGFEFLSRGTRGLMTIFSHSGNSNIMDLITGVLLISTFVGCNMFMALLIIQGIFDFGVALILYPFSVAAWVAKKSDKWFDIWPAFDEIIKALQKLVITMIACAFIMIVNVAIVHALFSWNSGIFNVAAGGNASSNLVTTAIDFGGHSMLWLSSLLTFFLMNAIFDMTKKQLEETYAPGMTGMYDQAKSDFKATTTWTKNAYTSIKKIIVLTK